MPKEYTINFHRVGTIDSFEQWSELFRSWADERTVFFVDQARRACRTTEDFERARDEHLFPIAIYKIGKP